jgi:hypothetical protein
MLQNVQLSTGGSRIDLWRPDASSDGQKMAITEQTAPAQISSVLWALSSPTERSALVAATPVASVGAIGAGGESVRVPLYRNDTAASFSRRIVEAVADKAHLDGKARADFIERNASSGIEYNNKSGEAAFRALYADTITGAVEGRLVTVGVNSLMAAVEAFKQSRTPGENAADAVRRELGGDWNPVGRDDAQRALDLINSLSGEEKRAAIANLASDGTLNRLAGSMTTDGFIAGLVSGAMTTDQQGNAMNALVKDLGGDELALLSRAFAGTPGSLGGRDAVLRFADAINTTATVDAKRDFVMANIGRMTDAPQFTQLGAFGSRREILGDIDAIAASRVLAKLDPTLPQTRQAFLKLAENPNEFAALLDASVGRTNQLGKPGIDGRAPQGDPSDYEAIMRNSATLSGSSDANDALKTSLFDQGISIATRARPEDQSRLFAAMTPIVNANAENIVGRSIGDGYSPNALKPYVAGLINSGNYAALGELKDRLAKGNDLAGNAGERFADGKSAGRLGWLAGTVQRVLDDNKANDKTRLDTWTAISKTGLKLADKFAPKAIGIPASILSEWVGPGLQNVAGASSNPSVNEQLKGASPNGGAEPTPKQKAEIAFFEAMVQRAQRAP